MELYFIRHGQSVSNANWNRSDFVLPPDPELTGTGWAQAARLAGFLKENRVRHKQDRWDIQNRHGFGLTHLYTSPMLRAVDTAWQVAKALDLPLRLWIDLHEEGGLFARQPDGSPVGFPGLTRSYYEGHYPGLLIPDEIGEDGWWKSRPVEPEGERLGRAARLLDELLDRHGDREGRPEERVALISHGGFFVLLMSVIFNMSWRTGANGLKTWLFMNNAAITRIDLRSQDALLCYHNRTEHLPAKLIT